MTIEIPLALRQAMESGQCVLFCGAGIGHNVTTPDGLKAPDGKALATAVAEKFGIAAGDEPNLAQVSQVAVIRKGRPELDAFLTKILADLSPDDSLAWLFNLRWRAIFTTNYDRVIQRAYEINPNPPQRPITISSTVQFANYDARFEVPIYHIHGCLFDPRSAHVLITDDDYARFREKRHMMFEVVKQEFAKSSVLYIGYSNSDPNWKTVLEELRSEFQGATLPPSFRVNPSTDPLDVEILASKGITTIAATTDEFVDSAQQVVSPVRVDPDALERLRGAIPTELHEAYENSPPAVSRMIGSWEYINQAAFDLPPNTQQYLAGDLPNWAAVGAEIPFKRDVEDSVFDQLLDFATDPKRAVSLVMLLSPAGYGNSTLQMNIASRLVRDRVGPVFYHRRGTPLVEGDVLFAASLFEEKPFFFIDNASDNVAAIEATARQLRESRVSAVLIIGERLNEWRQANPSVRGIEFGIEKLSDGEIDRLLEFLQTQGALGRLDDLSHPLRVAAIKNVHDKELLVAMKEATEGASFDAIIEDEYQNIANDTAKLLYAATCCTSLSRAHLRDQVAAKVVGLNLADLYQTIGSSLDGVIVWDCLDNSRELFGARARHQVIARVVWNRCLVEDEKEKVLLGIMRALNLNYHADARAFDSLIQSDENIDGIGSLEAKISFFETAAKKDPDSPYVLQHYARMLLREDKLELALAQIQRAKSLKQHARIIFHTEGMIYARLANSADSPEVGKRHLVNAERAFENSMDPGRRDAYAFQGLAELYFEWAKRCGDGDESTLYIRKAEEAISIGLRTVRERDGLWIMSSKISDWLGDHPAALEALEKAVAEEPTSNIARYLLARTNRRKGDLTKAKTVLKPAIERDPSDHRTSVAYALIEYGLGASPTECIAILRLSEETGKREVVPGFRTAC